MADDFDVASWVFGGKRLETSRGDSSMRACMGTATSDSDEGRVHVSVGDDATTVAVDDGTVVEGDTSLEMPTTVRVKEGDTAIIAIVNHRPTVIGVVGRGDEEHDGMVDAQIETEAAMQEVRDATSALAVEAAALSEQANDAISRISDAETTIEGLDGDVGKIKTTIRGIAEDTDESISAESTFEQTLASFLASVESAYTKGQASIDRSAAISIANDRIDAKVTQSYIDGKVGTRYISRSGSYTTADSIVSYVTTKATLKGVLDDEYTAQSTFTQRSNEITATFSEQSSRIGTLQSYIRLWSGGILVSKEDSPVGAWVNSSGTFDIVTLTWSGTAGSKTPTLVAKLMTLSGDTLTLGRANSAPEVRLTDAKNKVYSSTLTQSTINPISGSSTSQNYNFAGLQSYNTTSRPARVLAMSNASESRATLQAIRNSSVSANLGVCSTSGTAYAYTDRYFKLISANMDTYLADKDGIINEWDQNVSSTKTGNARIVFTDWNENTLGTVAARQYTNGNQTVYIESHIKLDSERDVYNTLVLGANRNGTRVVSVSEVAPWLKMLGLGDSSGHLPVTVAQGGTGGITASEARRNLSVAHEPGATISGSCQVGGYLTNANKSHLFTIPLTKHVNGTLTCTRLLVTARQGGGYILGNGSSGYDAITDGSTTKTFTVSPSGINVRLDLASGVGGTNNDAVGYAVTYTFTVS